MLPRQELWFSSSRATISCPFNRDSIHFAKVFWILPWDSGDDRIPSMRSFLGPFADYAPSCSGPIGRRWRLMLDWSSHSSRYATKSVVVDWTIHNQRPAVYAFHE